MFRFWSQGKEAMDAGQLYQRLGHIIQTMPSFLHSITPDEMLWLGRSQAVLEQTSANLDVAEFKVAMDDVIKETRTFHHNRAVLTVKAVLYRALARAELNAPVESQGSFIAAGSQVDALAAISKVLSPTKNQAMIIDPYMDEKTITDFVPLAPEGVLLRLLSDKRNVLPSLKPAVTRWIAQYPKRPIEVKITKPRALHDRLIMVDQDTVFVATQSLKDLATRSSASVIKVDGELAKLKIEAYEAIWEDAVPMD